MSAVRRFVQRTVTTVRAIVGFDRDDADAREELESHLAMQIDDNLRRGMSLTEARRAAQIVGGGLTIGTEAVHEQRGFQWLEDTATDFRHAARSLRNKPGFAVAVVLTLGLCIGANTAMFTIVNAVVLRPLPYPRSDQIVSVSLSDKGVDRGVVTDRDYFAWLADAKSATLAASSTTRGVITMRGGPEEIRGMRATAAYFAVLGVQPILGRTFDIEEDRPGAASVTVIGEALWRRGFGGDSGVVGRSIVIDGAPVTVIGVLPAAFKTPTHPEYWRPYRLRPASDGTTFFYQVVGRLRDGATMRGLRAELAAITARLDATRPPEGRGLTPVVMTLHERRYGDRRKPLLLLFGAVGVLLLIGCANLANLALARATGRQREIAVRLALGAGRWRLVRYMLAESLLLSASGGLLGLGLSVAGVGYFVRLSPSSVGNVDGIRADTFVLVFTLIVVAATGAIFGLIPAVFAGRQNLHGSLSVGSQRTGGGVRQQMVRRALVVAQLATALVLLTAAGLVARTLARVASIDPGFRADGLIATTVRLPEPQYSDSTAGPFFDQIVARVRSLPGVEAVAVADAPPLNGVRESFSKRDSAGREMPRIDVLAVGTDYFRTIGARIVEGRPIDQNDRPGSPPVAVVNTALARVLFPGASPIGKTIPFDGGVTVVGVVADVQQRDLEISAVPILYPSLAQQGASTYQYLVARTSGPIPALEAAIVQITRAIDATLPPPTFMRMDEALAESVAPRKFTFVLLGLFAALAATLAVVGLYGVLAHIVADRTREIGIRAALGADRGRVVRLIVKQGAVLVGLGILGGLVGATALTRLVTSLLYGVSPRDPITFTAVPVLLGTVAMLASLGPAWRAARVDPVIALRSE